MSRLSRRDLVDTGAAALAALAITALIEATTAAGTLRLVAHPLNMLTLCVAAPVAALATRRLRDLRVLHGATLVTATFALQLVLLLAWGASVTWTLARG
jgi:uncharacterized membrane protein YhaH (DUF805 family)